MPPTKQAVHDEAGNLAGYTMTDAPREPFRAFVSAIPTLDHVARYRGGPPKQRLRWTKDPVEVVVAERPDYKARPLVISQADYAALQRDPQIRAIPAGGGDPQIPMLKADMQKAAEQVAKLQAELAGMHEDHERDMTSARGRIEELVGLLNTREQELAGLRAELKKKTTRVTPG